MLAFESKGFRVFRVACRVDSKTGFAQRRSEEPLNLRVVLDEQEAHALMLMQAAAGSNKMNISSSSVFPGHLAGERARTRSVRAGRANERNVMNEIALHPSHRCRRIWRAGNQEGEEALQVNSLHVPALPKSNNWQRFF